MPVGNARAVFFKIISMLVGVRLLSTAFISAAVPATIGVAGGRVALTRILKKWRQNDGTYSVQFEVTYQ